MEVAFLKLYTMNVCVAMLIALIDCMLHLHGAWL